MCGDCTGDPAPSCRDYRKREEEVPKRGIKEKVNYKTSRNNMMKLVRTHLSVTTLDVNGLKYLIK